MSWFSQRSITPLVVCAALLAITYFGYGGWRYVAHNLRLSSDEQEIRQEIAQLDEQRSQLVAVRDYLRSEEYVEYVARSTLGLVKPGETLVIVSSSVPPVATPMPESPVAGAQGHEPWWKDLFVQPVGAPTPSP